MFPVAPASPRPRILALRVAMKNSRAARLSVCVLVLMSVISGCVTSSPTPSVGTARTARRAPEGVKTDSTAPNSGTTLWLTKMDAGRKAQGQGRAALAEESFREAIAIAERSGAESSLHLSLFGLANVYYDEGRYAEEEPLLRRTIAILEKIHQPRMGTSPL